MSDFAAQLAFIVDPDSDPVNLDEAVARFLLALVRSPAVDAPTPESNVAMEDTEGSNDTDVTST